jgi:hypothetical protein
MLGSNHKGAQRALEQAIAAERAKLVSAHAVQRCLYEVLWYADGEDAVVYAEAAHVVATLVEGAVDKLDSIIRCRANPTCKFQAFAAGNCISTTDSSIRSGRGGCRNTSRLGPARL